MSDRGKQPACSGKEKTPCADGMVYEHLVLGITIREYMATHIAAGSREGFYPKETAEWAVRRADALLAELAKEKESGSDDEEPRQNDNNQHTCRATGVGEERLYRD